MSGNWSRKREGGTLMSELSKDDFKRMPVHVQAEKHKRLKALAFSNDTDMGCVVRYLIDRALAGDIEMDWHEIREQRRQ